MKITVIFTCFNRKEKSLECVERLIKGNRDVEFQFVVVDDGSTDGTKESLKDGIYAEKVHVLETEGNCYYSGGMNRGMQYILDSGMKSEYLLMVNDDVKFFEKSIEKLVMLSEEKENSVIVGVTCDEKEIQTYGAIKYDGGFSVRYHAVPCADKAECDTFNANCVLIPFTWFEKTGVMDKNYIHSLGDFDYGLSLKKNGAKIYSSDEFVGICHRNSIKGTWQDKELPLVKRLKLKESPKGAPAKQWFYFLKKNFGVTKAIVFTITPYVNMILGR